MWERAFCQDATMSYARVGNITVHRGMSEPLRHLKFQPLNLLYFSCKVQVQLWRMSLHVWCPCVFLLSSVLVFTCGHVGGSVYITAPRIP